MSTPGEGPRNVVDWRMCPEIQLTHGTEMDCGRVCFMTSASHIELPMATTYMQLAQQIKALQAQAELTKKKEIVEVIARIKDAISVYSLTAEELGFGVGSGAKPSTAKAAGRAKSAKAGRGTRAATKQATVAYRDDAGNTWGGRGPRPAWLRTAIQGGAELASFAVGASRAAQPVTADRAPVVEPAAPVNEARTSKARKSPKASTVKYKDEAGHTWSGFGPKPGWFKEALVSGKTPEELAAA